MDVRRPRGDTDDNVINDVTDKGESDVVLSNGDIKSHPPTGGGGVLNMELGEDAASSLDTSLSLVSEGRGLGNGGSKEYGYVFQINE